MSEKLTPQQLQAVTDRGGNLLVSAAAGSGKTKVLVDRLMGYISDPTNPANIDDFLIITYTKAAAAELRGKIATKLSKMIADSPGNRHLRQQMQRLYLTQISTVHAFCTDILREYAYRTDIPADFRVAEENECLEIQLGVLTELLESAYCEIDTDRDFYELVNSQGLGRDDRQIPEIVLKVYNSSCCHLNPDAWLDWCLDASTIENIEDVSQTIWGAYLIEELDSYLDLQIHALEKCVNMAAENGNMEKPLALLNDTVYQLRRLRECKKWDDIIRLKDIDYGRLIFSKKCAESPDVEHIKAVRSSCKKGLEKKLRKFSDNSCEILRDMHQIAAAQRGVVSLTKKFSAAYKTAKKRKRVLDFSDLEQSVIDLLMGKGRNTYTLIADEIGDRFREVMVDEYQDSNAVQDAIFTAITYRNNNCFMVGDVKQSIYQFRLADPDIFLAKYNLYKPAGRNAPGEGRKVLLSNNFRSSGAIIEAVNDVFSTCMSVSVGGLDYGEDESLYEGIPHKSLEDPDVELYAINVQEDSYNEEADFVACRICELLDGTHTIREGDGFRAIKPEDIVILLRSPGSVGSAFLNALEKQGIRCTTGSGTDLLHTEEIETLRSLLQVVDNPLQDIPLVATLTSRLFCFAADDLAQMRCEHPGGSVYSSLRASNNEKVRGAWQTIENLRHKARINSLPKLIQYIFDHTNLDAVFASLDDGESRVENLQNFYQFVCDAEASGVKNLNSFIKYLDVLEEKGICVGGDKKIAGAVTIMSIHKSKGLEFPVVFLCGLSRGFNQDSVRSQILCDKDLGLGLSCVDTTNRIRYPSLAKRAIASKMIAESISEEMRVLYVAMTRPRDRLIMTYASRNIESTLKNIVSRMDVCDPLLLTCDVDCPGKWVLLTALRHSEASALFAISGYPLRTQVYKYGWKVRVIDGATNHITVQMPVANITELDSGAREQICNAVSYCYPYVEATRMPSKQTATQLKGRFRDQEAAQNTKDEHRTTYKWRRPKFVENKIEGKEYGNVIHAVMHFIDYKACTDMTGVEAEIARLTQMGFISKDQGLTVNAADIAAFFDTELGKQIRESENVLREFKFTLLIDSQDQEAKLQHGKILLQGVIDCALIEQDGITVIDFKTDKVTENTVLQTAEQYRAQVMAYADALERIYEKPVKSKQLYFFSLGKFVSIV